MNWNHLLIVHWWWLLYSSHFDILLLLHIGASCILLPNLLLSMDIHSIVMICSGQRFQAFNSMRKIFQNPLNSTLWDTLIQQLVNFINQQRSCHIILEEGHVQGSYWRIWNYFIWLAICWSKSDLDFTSNLVVDKHFDLQKELFLGEINWINGI